MKGQEDAAKDLGVEVSIVSSDNEISKESDNVATFLAQQVDALVNFSSGNRCFCSSS